MTIELTEKTVGIWYMQVTEKSDWLAAVTEVDDGFLFQYRFRYYEDHKAFDSKDRKNWYEGVLHVPKDYVINTLRSMMKMMCGEYDDIKEEDCYELLRDPTESWDIFLTRFSQLPFNHTMMVLDDDR